MSDLAIDIGQRLAEIQDRIAMAAHRGGRDASSVQLIAVTKTHGPDLVRAAAEAGLRHFGENRVEEAKTKIDVLQGMIPDDVVWHMIGHIQSRKADDVAGYFSWVHSLDRLKVARILDTGLGQRNRSAEVLLEVNLSGEEAKSGFDLSAWPSDAQQSGAFDAAVEEILALPNLRVCGLMTVPPIAEDPEVVRPIFSRMRQLRDTLSARFGENRWRHLSMGMSGDYEVAIEEGATMVRLGTALFGPRA